MALSKFRSIDYGKMLYETLRNYYSVNAQGKISLLYQYLACLIQPLIAPWDNYENNRLLNGLIADTKWQIGQLTIVLNYLFDPNLKRIYITQASYTNVDDPEFAYPPVNFDDVFADTPLIFEREFDDALGFVMLTFHIPSTVNEAAVTAVIEQIRLQGIQYRIVIFSVVS
jgi:hypothetical protein